MVIHRYGDGFSGGAEYECKALSEHLLTYFDVDVLTSCSQSHNPWDNYFSQGEEEINV